MSINSLYFIAPSQASPLHTWRLCTQTATTYVGLATVEMAFTFTDRTDYFNLTSTSPYTYMTLSHVGTNSSTSGIQVCLVRKNSDSNAIQIGIRTKTTLGTWSELSGSFYALTDVATNSFMFMLSYDYTLLNRKINFYVTIFNNSTTKTTPDFTFTTVSAPSITIGTAIGIGSVCENIDSTGYISTQNYNSYVAQNISVSFIRVWNTVIPATSASSSSYAMFNSSSSSHSLYATNKSQLYVPAGSTNLNFQLYIPTNSFNITDLANNAVTPSVALTCSTEMSLLVTMIPPITHDVEVNSSSSYTVVSQSNINCFVEGTKILTPNGYTPVEKLKVGDEVMTNRGIAKKITKQKLFIINGNAQTYPCAIRKGCYGATEDTFISQGHAILIGDEFVHPFNLGL